MPVVQIVLETNPMKNVLPFAAAGEIATGLALIAVPSLVSRLLLGEDLAGTALPVARVLGTTLVALGVACWPGLTLRCGMLVYSGAVTLYLAYLGLVGGFHGILLWPVVVIHAILTALLGLPFARKTESKT